MKWKDTEETNAENDESYEDLNYSQDYSPLGSGKRGGFISRLFNRAEFPIVMLGIGLLVLIIILFVYLPGGQKSTSSNDLIELKKSIKQMEDRLANLETGGTKNEKEDQQAAKYNQLNSKIRKMEKSVESRMNKMNTKLEGLKNKVAAMKPLKASLKETVKGSNKNVKERTHLVRTGETLYSISKQYEISVDALRALNKLDAKKDIYPGQKLKIKTK